MLYNKRNYSLLSELKTLSVCQLNDLYLELELLIRDYSETLIAELALRDELEYEKELKNSFISLLLAVQNRRRQHHVEKKRGRTSGNKPAGVESKVYWADYIQCIIDFSTTLLSSGSMICNVTKKIIITAIELIYLVVSLKLYSTFF